MPMYAVLKIMRLAFIVGHLGNPFFARRPRLSPTMLTGVLERWALRVGDEVLSTDVICDVSPHG